MRIVLLVASAAGLVLAAGSAQAGECNGEIMALQAQMEETPTMTNALGTAEITEAAGGTLVQDIPSEMTGALEHKLDVPPNEPFTIAHEVWLEKDSLLARLASDADNEGDSRQVNSRHHQAVKQVAPNFNVSATAPDGVIEAIEDPSAPFCLAVQWHPENFWRTGEFRPLFETFVEAAQMSENPKT